MGVTINCASRFLMSAPNSMIACPLRNKEHHPVGSSHPATAGGRYLITSNQATVKHE